MNRLVVFTAAMTVSVLTLGSAAVFAGQGCSTGFNPPALTIPPGRAGPGRDGPESSGWAIDDVGPTRVQIFVGGASGEVYLGDGTRVRGARPDVAATSWAHSPGGLREGVPDAETAPQVYDNMDSCMPLTVPPISRFTDSPISPYHATCRHIAPVSRPGWGRC